MDEQTARAMIHWTMNEWMVGSNEEPPKAIFLEYGAGSFDGVYETRGPYCAYCWWWGSKDKDQTEVRDSGTDKVKKVARIAGNGVKLVGPGIVGGLCSALVPLPGVGDTISLGLSAASTAHDGGGGFMQSNFYDSTWKAVKSDLKHKARGTQHWATVVRDDTIVYGGCAEFKNFVGGSVLVKVKYWIARNYNSMLAIKERQYGNYQALKDHTSKILEDPSYALAVSPGDIAEFR